MAEKIDGCLAGDETLFVLSFNLADHFDKVSTSALRAHFGNKLVTFTNIHFNGLHPDMTYIGPMGQRIAGFFGDYHSKLVLFGYAEQRSVDDCVALFNGANYEKIGFLGMYQSSTAELLQRDRNCDVKFGPMFLEMLRVQPCLYTINHPTGPVFIEMSAMLAAHCGLEFITKNPVNFQNHLAQNYIWPVYNEIAESHRLQYRLPQFFFKANQRPSRAFNLREFVAGCYAAYSGVEFGEFSGMVKNLPFYANFKNALG